MSQRTSRAVKINGDVATTKCTSGSDSYNLVVHCENRAETIRAAVEKAVINFNIGARAGKYVPGETYHLTPWGEVHKTTEQLFDEMTPESQAAFLAMAELKIKAAKKAA